MANTDEVGLREYLNIAGKQEYLAVVESLDRIIGHCLKEMGETEKRKTEAESMAIWATITMLRIGLGGASYTPVAEKFDGVSLPRFPSDRIYSEKTLKRHYKKMDDGAPTVFKARCEMVVTWVRFRVDSKAASNHTDARRMKAKRNAPEIQEYLNSLSSDEYRAMAAQLAVRELQQLWLAQDFHWDEWSERKRQSWEAQLEDALDHYIGYSDSTSLLRGKSREFRQAWLDSLRLELMQEVLNSVDRFPNFCP